MMEPPSMRDSKRSSWQMYLGVGILAAIAGYALSAMPQLIVPVVSVGLAVWLIYSGLRRHRDQAIDRSPMELTRRFLKLRKGQGRLRDKTDHQKRWSALP
jgi:hypothetical protein